MALKENGRYDGSLHMFVEAARSPDPRRLRFLRWLVEHNRFGRPPVGPSSGELAPVTDEDVPEPTLPSAPRSRGAC